MILFTCLQLPQEETAHASNQNYDRISIGPEHSYNRYQSHLFPSHRLQHQCFEWRVDTCRAFFPLRWSILHSVNGLVSTWNVVVVEFLGAMWRTRSLAKFDWPSSDLALEAFEREQRRWGSSVGGPNFVAIRIHHWPWRSSVFPLLQTEWEGCTVAIEVGVDSDRPETPSFSARISAWATGHFARLTHMTVSIDLTHHHFQSSFVNRSRASFRWKQHFNSSIIIISNEMHFHWNVSFTKLKCQTESIAEWDTNPSGVFGDWLFANDWRLCDEDLTVFNRDSFDSLRFDRGWLFARHDLHWFL
jgi:hypothetical protein